MPRVQNKQGNGFLFVPYFLDHGIKMGIQGQLHVKVRSEPSQTSQMELFAKIVNGFLPLTIFPKNSI